MFHESPMHIGGCQALLEAFFFFCTRITISHIAKQFLKIKGEIRRRVCNRDWGGGGSCSCTAFPVTE
jgi:hypothetical protein